MGERAGAHTLPEARPVTVRVQPGMRLLAVGLMGGLLAGLAGSVVLALRAGDPGAPFGAHGWTGTVVVGWLVVAALLVVLPCALLVILTLRTTLTTSRTESRLGWHHARVTLHEASHVSYSPPAHHGATGPTAARLTVHAADGSPVATFSQRETDWPLVLANLREWVRVRPALVRDERTAEVFTALEGL